jgi:hypothetical protein
VSKQLHPPGSKQSSGWGEQCCISQGCLLLVVQKYAKLYTARVWQTVSSC